MILNEDRVATAARHVRESEARVDRLRALVEDLIRDHHARTVANAQRSLDLVRRSLELARTHLRLEEARSRREGG